MNRRKEVGSLSQQSLNQIRRLTRRLKFVPLQPIVKDQIMRSSLSMSMPSSSNRVFATLELISNGVVVNYEVPVQRKVPTLRAEMESPKLEEIWDIGTKAVYCTWENLPKVLEEAHAAIENIEELAKEGKLPMGTAVQAL